MSNITTIKKITKSTTLSTTGHEFTIPSPSKTKMRDRRFFLIVKQLLIAGFPVESWCDLGDEVVECILFHLKFYTR